MADKSALDGAVLRVRFVRAKEGFIARVLASDSSGALAIEREYTGPTCAGLAKAAEVVAAIALRETHAVREEAAKRDEAKKPATERAVETSKTSVVDDEPSVAAPQVRSAFSANFVLLAGILPKFAPGLEVEARFRLRPHWSVGGSLFAMPDQATASDRFAASLFGGTVGTCLETTGRVRLGGCARIWLAWFAASSRVPGITNPSGHVFFAASVGPSARFLVAGPLELGLGAAAIVPIAPLEILTNGQNIEFKQRAIGLDARATIGMSFF